MTRSGAAFDQMAAGVDALTGVLVAVVQGEIDRPGTWARRWGDGRLGEGGD